eukprot:CAMPEP_0172610048 /NCGR_PEP_ID=MMETSP1068-20121228/29921_1 /TAXON_ID=35684 /ORGANISM="Pseudopedinella elastica, Strain CCMP716" /LENGTH=548 /DNA_ID=CAMNT_0013413681 /DNA_START=121 /DNA_END=1767 /DNA_ORIENTATION=+
MATESATDAWTCPVRPAISVPSCTAGPIKCPSVDGAITFIGGVIEPFAGEIIDVKAPIVDEETGKQVIIGRMAQMTEAHALKTLEAAKAAWDGGQGVWPQMSAQARIDAMEKFVAAVKERRSEIIDVLMWEICKNTADAAKEFDRTMDFVAASIAALKKEVKEGFLGEWTAVSGFVAKMRRGPVGVNLMLAPFNYPLNEMYAMLIPALLMGNVVVMKLPNIGGLAHVLTAEAFQAALPPGVVNFLTGSGRVTCTPVMKDGAVDMLGFIGGSKAADALIGSHPRAHRLKVFSQLEGKNMGIVLEDADLKVAAAQCRAGSTSYNGQRCTAIKLVMVHEAKAEEFLELLIQEVQGLKAGLPWEDGVSITPLPEPNKPAYLEELIADAVSKGATVVNADTGGGTRSGALFQPAIVYPVTSEMRLFHEEQFGPVIPVAKFASPSEPLAAAKQHWNGQQSAIFTADPTGESAAKLVDGLATIVGRINLNVQCARSPDVFPFSGRRSSAMGTMSVTAALQYFSIETSVVYEEKSEVSAAAARGIDAKSNFLKPIS